MQNLTSTGSRPARSLPAGESGDGVVFALIGFGLVVAGFIAVATFLHEPGPRRPGAGELRAEPAEGVGDLTPEDLDDSFDSDPAADGLPGAEPSGFVAPVPWTAAPVPVFPERYAGSPGSEWPSSPRTAAAAMYGPGVRPPVMGSPPMRYGGGSSTPGHPYFRPGTAAMDSDDGDEEYEEDDTADEADEVDDADSADDGDATGTADDGDEGEELDEESEELPDGDGLDLPEPDEFPFPDLHRDARSPL